jgi:carboxymethylenebutenolidase
VRVALPSGTPAELAEGTAPCGRGLVIAPDIMGLRPLFDDLCARLAIEHRWAVCAVEPFAGQESLSLDDRLATGVAALDDDRQLGDLVAAADVLRERTGVERVGVLGFCMGGMYAFKAAGTGRFDRAVAFYGMIRLPEHWVGSGQREPLEHLSAEGRCPVLAILGGRDHFTPPQDIDALRALPDVEAVVYPEAEHGFVHDASRPAHRADDAADAWRRVTEFLTLA